MLSGSARTRRFLKFAALRASRACSANVPWPIPAAKICARREGVFRLDVVHHEHIVEPDLHLPLPHKNADREPIAIAHQLLVDVAQTAKRSGFAALHKAVWAAVVIRQQYLEPLRRHARRFRRSVKADAVLRVWPQHHIHTEFEVPEIRLLNRARIKERSRTAVRGNLSAFNLEGAQMSGGLPPASDLPSKREIHSPDSSPSACTAAGAANSNARSSRRESWDMEPSYRSCGRRRLVERAVFASNCKQCDGSGKRHQAHKQEDRRVGDAIYEHTS